MSLLERTLWVGFKTNTSGSYRHYNQIPGLAVRTNTPRDKLLHFDFGEYLMYISDEAIYDKIINAIKCGDYESANEELYRALIEKISLKELLHQFDLIIEEEKKISFDSGARSTKREIREVLGIPAPSKWLEQQSRTE